MERKPYSSGEVGEKLGLSRRTVTYRAAKGRIPGQIPLIPGQKPDEGPPHRRYSPEVIDQMAEGYWPPIEFSLRDRAFEIKFKGLASGPFRLVPCPGELPEVTAPELHLPGGPTLSAWHLPPIASPFEVAEKLRQHLFCI